MGSKGSGADLRVRRRLVPQRVAIGVGVVLTATLAGCIGQKGGQGSLDWKPAAVENLTLAAGQKEMAAGHGYNSIATRAQDPQPMSVRQAPKLGSSKYVNLSSNCDSMVTSLAVRHALSRGGCSQVLRTIGTVSSSNGNSTRLVYVFNLISGSAVYRAARAFGEENPAPSTITMQLGFPGNFSPSGFVRSWPKTPAENMAGTSGNFAYVDGFGHFLLVAWSGGASSIANETADGLADTAFSQYVGSRINCGAPLGSQKRDACTD